MSYQTALLLTTDRELEKTCWDVSPEGWLFVARDPGEALQVVCQQGKELDLAVIDFGEGCHGMSLLSAVQICRPGLPILVVISNDTYRAAAVAYANGVDAVLAKPVTTEELGIVINKLTKPKLLLEAA